VTSIATDRASNFATERFDNLPMGCAPIPVATPHFPDALHAVVWRNWDVVEADVLAEVLRATTTQIQEVAFSMGLPHNDPSPPKRAGAII
jgi:hypothetical protein